MDKNRQPESEEVKLREQMEKLLHLLGLCQYLNAAVLVCISLFFFLIPGFIVIHELSDPNIRSAGIPQSTWQFHRDLSPKFEQWCKERLASQRSELSTNNISGTEWPLFGVAFYLWATESLQDEWERGHAPGAIAPNVYARGAIDAATRLTIDPAQAGWVKVYWGTNYLNTEDAFYRMLIISALTCHARLTGDKEYLPMLKGQCDSLSAELDASRHGLLDDYPGQCYPGDVVTSIAMIRRADRVLGSDHSAFVERAIRGFQNRALDYRGLVPYYADASMGVPIGLSRGCANSYVSLFAPEIWPQQARKWYDMYTKYFWQEKWTCAGFREYPNDMPGNDWNGDIDSGLVLKGFGCAACAYGVGAARANGHFEHAYPLTAEMLVTSWPLPNGTRLLPRLLSNVIDAPYVGETAILFNLTRMPADGVDIKTGGSLPKFVIIFLTLQFCAGLLLLAVAVLSVRKWRNHRDSMIISHPEKQFGIWLAIMVAALICLLCGKVIIALVLLICAQLIPRCKRKLEIKPASN